MKLILILISALFMSVSASALEKNKKPAMVKAPRLDCTYLQVVITTSKRLGPNRVTKKFRPLARFSMGLEKAEKMIYTGYHKVKETTHIPGGQLAADAEMTKQGMAVELGFKNNKGKVIETTNVVYKDKKEYIGKFLEMNVAPRVLLSCVAVEGPVTSPGMGEKK